MQRHHAERSIRDLLRTGVLALALASAAGWAMGSMVPGVVSAHGRTTSRPGRVLVQVGVRLPNDAHRAPAGAAPLPLPVLHLDGNPVALRSGRMIDPPVLHVSMQATAHAEGSRVRKPRRALVHDSRRTEAKRPARTAKRVRSRDTHKATVRSAVVDTMTVLATAYWPDPAWSTGYTATGWKAQYGIVAVDPSVIPLGTKMYIPGYGQAIAEDTGGAIIGDHIDLCYDDQQQAVDWGAQTIHIEIEQWG